MATFTLTGTGTHSLTPGTVALRVTVTTLPTSAGSGFSYPADQYGVGFLRFTDGTAYWDPWPIVGGPQWIPVPNGSAGVGYALLSVSAVSITEVSSPAPLAFPLSALPDVALSGPADTQVLTYQASSSKWVNAAAPTGGGGGTGSLTTNGYTGAFDAALDFLALNHGSLEQDTLINVGSWYAFVWIHTSTTAGTFAATNAKLTVPSGKSLVVVDWWPTAVMWDTGQRGATFFDQTASTDLVSNLGNSYSRMQGLIHDGNTAQAFPTAPSGHVVVARAVNGGGSGASRSTGGVWMCRTVP